MLRIFIKRILTGGALNVNTSEENFINFYFWPSSGSWGGIGCLAALYGIRYRMGSSWGDRKKVFFENSKD
jgi:hypothetical protein